MSKAIARSFKNVVNGYTSAQVKVRNATSNEPYGPSTSDMEDIADHTYEHVEFLEVMDMLDKRLNDKGKNWRHVAKALTVLDYLVRAGSENVVRWSKDNLYVIKTLREFQYTDEQGQDQGTVIRVKAKELTSLLRDDERLRQERELRASRRSRHNGRHRRNPDGEEDVDDEDEDALAKALRESRRTAEEDERRRLGAADDEDGLETALRLSREEEEARRAKDAQSQNLLDLSEPTQQQYGVQYDIWGNPIYPAETGYGQNAFDQQQYLQQQQLQQQQLQQQQLQQQQEAYLQQQQQEWLQQQYLQQQYLQQQQQQQQQQQLLAQQTAQQQYLQQQQLLAQQQQAQQQVPLRTGANNPFALDNQQTSSAPEQPKIQEAPTPLTKVPTGSQQKNEQFSELNTLLAQGTGIDTFGNEGNLRIPAQFTRQSTFINSSGTGIRPQDTNSANPFLQTQYTGVASTGVIPSYTGYGFGNQNQQQQSKRVGEQSLIDI